MVTVFWYRKGVLLVKLMPKGYTINAEENCNTLKELRRNVQNRRRGMLSRGVSLLHDNARLIQQGVDFSGTAHFIWMGNRQPPPLFTRSDTRIFICLLKEFMGGKRHSNDDEVKQMVEKWLKIWRERSTIRAYKSWSLTTKMYRNLRRLCRKIIYYICDIFCECH